MKENKKVVYIIIGIISMLLVAVGITYAYWLVTRTQEGENIISTGCIDIDLIEKTDEIYLTNQYPLTNAEGMTLEPYIFTLTNKCDNEVEYQIALDSLTDPNYESISASSIKVMLDNSYITKLSEAKETTTSETDAYASHILGYGTLSKKGQETHKIRLWIDENAPINDANKSFISKIRVSAGQDLEMPIDGGNLTDYVLATIYNVKVGDYVNYDAITGAETTSYLSSIDHNGYGDQSFNLADYTDGWQVLGVEDGKLKLISSKIVQPATGGTTENGSRHSYYALKGEIGYAYGIEELDVISSMFGQGRYAESARSVNISDLESITLGFDPYTIEQIGNDTNWPYGSGKIGEYDTTVTYKINSENMIEYTGSNGSTLTAEAGFFYNYNRETKQFLDYNEMTEEDKAKTYTVKNNLFFYYPVSYYGVKASELLAMNLPWVNLLYAKALAHKATWASDENVYWIANNRDYAYGGWVGYGAFVVDARGFGPVTLSRPKKNSDGTFALNEQTHYYGIRPVVTLSENIMLSAEADETTHTTQATAWNIVLK